MKKLLKILNKRVRTSRYFKKSTHNTSSNDTSHFNLTNSPQNYNSQKISSFSELSPIQLIPIEIFVMICNYLTPQDLYSLCSICKYFRTILWSKTIKTQMIWEKSRSRNQKEYFYYLSPPKNMTEQEYVWRTTMINKYYCQYCSVPIVMIYYDLYTTNIICCEDCIYSKKYGIIKYKYDRIHRLPKKFEDAIIPTRHFNLNPNYYKLYWFKDIEKIKRQYYSLKRKERKLWLEEKRREVKLYMKNIDKYIKQDEIRLRNGRYHKFT
ncbi:hypothetical protein C1645_833979 [Glomus cerebriforme]|uniref:F-box domain-containing protein n=1 Tax=Glomus cerebriforme TaxID=658196 RepID=A0A397SH93_9GLOM|nr:hypothetical protein C1645_833979 [Glomus cerebriforme]